MDGVGLKENVFPRGLGKVCDASDKAMNNVDRVCKITRHLVYHGRVFTAAQSKLLAVP